MTRRARSEAADEQVVLATRTHAKALAVPSATLVLLGGVLGAGMALVPSSYRPAGQYVVASVVVVLALWWSVAPFLRWWGHTYTITTHRLVTREGVLRRSGHGVPLARILDVSYERSLGDRLLGCGTLVVQTAAEGALVLHDVPGVGYVHSVLSDLVLSAALERDYEGHCHEGHDHEGHDHEGHDVKESGYEDAWSASPGRRW